MSLFENFDRAADIETETMERAAFCADDSPPNYLEAWARLNHQKPLRVSDAEWRLPLNDAGLFLDRCGSYAAIWGWPVADLFDVPREGKAGGLIWFIGAEAVEAFGPEYARLGDGRIFDRMARNGEAETA